MEKEFRDFNDKDFKVAMTVAVHKPTKELVVWLGAGHEVYRKTGLVVDTVNSPFELPEKMAKAVMATNTVILSEAFGDILEKLVND